MSRRLGPLAERNFRLFFAARTISLLGTAISPVAVAFAVLDDLGGSPTSLGLVLTAFAVPQVLFVVLGGVVGDRLRRNRVLIATDAALFASQATSAGLLLTGSAELWHLVILQAVNGTAIAFFLPTAQAVVPDVVDRALLQPANALVRLAQSTTRVFGAVTGGLLVAAAGAGWALAFDACTYVVSAFLIAAIRIPGTVELAARSLTTQLREGWDEFRSRTWLWSMVAAAAVGNLLFGSLFVLGPAVADDHLGGAPAWGLILSAQGAGFVAGGVLMLRWRPGRPLVAATLWIAAGGALFAALAADLPLPLIAAAAFLQGFGADVFGVTWATALQEHVPRERLSRVSAYDALGSYVFVPVGLAIAGPTAAVIGLSTTLWVVSALWVAQALAPLLARSVRELRPSPSPASADARIAPTAS